MYISLFSLAKCVHVLTLNKHGFKKKYKKTNLLCIKEIKKETLYSNNVSHMFSKHVGKKKTICINI